MKIQKGNESVETLEKLNTALSGLTGLIDGGVALPLKADSFSTTNDPTADEIDEAIKESDDELYDYMELADVIAAVDKELAVIVKDPDHFRLVENSGVSAYINDDDVSVDDQAEKLLVNAAHGLGKAEHDSSKMRGQPDDMDGYVHLSGPNQLYAYRLDGEHRGYPKVVVLKGGSVNAGWHEFS